MSWNIQLLRKSLSMILNIMLLRKDIVLHFSMCLRYWILMVKGQSNLWLYWRMSSRNFSIRICPKYKVFIWHPIDMHSTQWNKAYVPYLQLELISGKFLLKRIKNSLRILLISSIGNLLLKGFSGQISLGIKLISWQMS